MASRGFCQRQKQTRGTQILTGRSKPFLPLLAARQRSRVLIESVPAMCIRFTVTTFGADPMSKEAARALFHLVGRPIRQHFAFAAVHRRHVELQLAALGDHRLLEATPDPREGRRVRVQHLAFGVSEFKSSVLDPSDAQRAQSGRCETMCDPCQKTGDTWTSIEYI